MLSSPAPPFEALARSEVYLFLARAFAYPQKPLDELYRRARVAARALGAVPELEALEPPDQPGLEACYQATFTHTTPVEFPPYETQYGRGHIFRQPQSLAEIAAVYRAFGLQPASGERLDHICTELEFMYFLCYKEAFALLANNAEGAERCAEGQKYFLQRHLGRWALIFLERLGRHADGFYARLATLTGAWLAREAAELDTPLSPMAEEDLLAAQRAEWFCNRLSEITPACEDGM